MGGKIELRGVNFSYPTRPDIAVCKDYNLVINPGEVIALVGPSGSGKSTIMSLLLRFYDPSSGQVLLDGTDIKEMNVRWLRSQIGYVGQEPVLFSGPIATNISKGRSSYGDTELMTLDECMALSDENTRNGVDTVAETKKNAVKAVLSRILRSQVTMSRMLLSRAMRMHSSLDSLKVTVPMSVKAASWSAAGKSSVSPLPAPWSRSPLFSCRTKRPPLWTLLLRRWSRSLSTSYRQVRLRLPSSSLTD